MLSDTSLPVMDKRKNCCVEPAKSFKTNWHLKRHLVSHENKINCIKCRRKFLLQGALNIHYKKSEIKGEVTCEKEVNGWLYI